MDYVEDLTPYNNKEDSVINWEMDEFLERKRGLSWYLLSAAAAIFLSVASFLIIGDIIAPISILVMSIIVALYSFKKPERKKYSLTVLGLKVGSRLYDYSSFRTFSLIKENGIAALYLITNERFLPPLVIYLPRNKDRYIIKRLSHYIAYTPSGLPWTDRFMQYLRL